MYTEGSLIVINPYLRLKYHIFVLRSENRTLYIIMEKEKELEKPNFSEYDIDWLYDHLILIGFKDKKDIKVPILSKRQDNNRPKTL